MQAPTSTNGSRSTPHRLLAALLPLLVLLGVTACGGGADGSSDGAAGGGATADQASAGAEASTMHHVACGCILPEYGACGNYIEVDGKMVPLVLPADSKLPDMPFCGKGTLDADAEGAMQDGKFVATAFALRPVETAPTPSDPAH